MELGQGYYALWALFVYGLAALYLLARAGKRPILPVCAGVATLCLSALLTAQTAAREDLALTVLDVGQGQSIVVQSAGVRALIDCGGSLDPGTGRPPISSPRGGAPWTCSSSPTFTRTTLGACWSCWTGSRWGHRHARRGPGQPPPPGHRGQGGPAGIPIRSITENTRAELGLARLTLYRPVEGGKESNEKCLSVLCAKDGWEALITGDMPAEEEALLAAREELPDAEVLVAGHHGSQYATGEKLLAAVTPERVVISVGDNAYGHPAPETLERIQAAGAEVYRTDWHGGGDGACPVRKRPAPRENSHREETNGKKRTTKPPARRPTGG